MLDDPWIETITQWQQPDGWLAWDFHGQKSLETGIRVLCEKGVSRRHPVLAKALRSLQVRSERLVRGIGKVGSILDRRGFGGSEMIRATLLAYAGLEHKPCVQQQVQVALEGMRTVLEVRSVHDLAEPRKDKLVYKDGLRWPGIYHLRLLAFTRSWRNSESCRVVTAAVQRMADLSPLPAIYVFHESQMVAPASFAMRNFNPDMRSMDSAQWMMWFHRMECLARLGVVAQVPTLHAQACTLVTLLDEGRGRFPLTLHHPYFTKWGPYTGLALERDWHSARRRTNDLTFRSLLILHFAGLS